jgi:hypothetical protein
MQDATDGDWTDLVSRDMLTRRISLDEYQAEHVELANRGLISQSKIESDRAMLEALARSGEEWWEWVMGTEPCPREGHITTAVDRGRSFFMA